MSVMELGKHQPTPAQPRLEVWLLGDFEVQIDGRGVGQELPRRSKAGQIIKLLAVAPHHRLHREQVLAGIWPELDGDAGSNNLGRNLFEARRILEPSRHQGASFEFLRLEHNQLVLGAPDDIWIDATAFERAAHAADDRRACESALRLYRGELLPSDRLADWTFERRRSLQDAYVKLLRRTATYQDSDGDSSAAVMTLEMLIAVEPTDEPAYVELMRLFAGQGDRTRAVRLYRRLEETLRIELDTEPGDSARRMLEVVLSRRPDAMALVPVQSDVRSFPLDSVQLDQADGPLDPEVPEPLPARPVRARTNLPHMRRPFIGRENEIAVVCEVLLRPEVALLTLTGPGGIGKTRLAIESVSGLVQRFEDGVWLVSLASITEPSLVMTSIARTLGVPEALGQSAGEGLKSELRSKRLLLVLDSFEQVAEAAVEVADLVADCPQLKVLVTSRRPLHLSDEYEFPVPPLPLPDQSRPAVVHELARCPSVAFFVERASAVRPGFALSEFNARAVAEICARLDGLPLAIELAATRIRFLTPEVMLGRLERCLPMLEGGLADMPQRHQTLRATTAWSYDLLTPEEKRLFRECAVFVGGFSLEAAERVCSQDDASEPRLLANLASLVDQSLVWHEELPGGDPRFSLLQTIREFAIEQLEPTSEGARLREAHAAYYLSFAQDAELMLIAASDEDWLNRVEREHDNFRAVFRYALDSGDIEPGLLLAGILRPFWQIRGHMREGMEWLTRLLAASSPEARTVGRAKALNAAGFASVMLGNYDDALRLATECVSIYRDLDEQRGMVESLHHLGLALRCIGQYEASEATLEEGLTISRELGLRLWEGRILHAYSRTVFNAGDPQRARKLLEAAITCQPEIEDTWARAMALGDLSDVARSTHDRPTALAALRESLEIWRRLGHQRGIAQCLESLALLLSDEADARESETVVRLLAGAAAIRLRVADPSSPVRRGEIRQALESTRTQLPVSAFDSAWEAGSLTPPIELFDEAFPNRR